MQQPKVHAEAISHLYSAQLCVLVGESLFKKVSRHLPGKLEVFCLSSDGVISRTAGVAGNDTAMLHGYPNNVVAILAGRSEHSAATAFIEHTEKHGAHRTPKLMVCKKNVLGMLNIKAVLKFVTSALLKNTSKTQAFAADSVHELAALRELHERQSLEYKKARNLLKVLSGNAKNIVMELAPGSESISQPGKGSQYRQVLPSDLTAFSGVWLFVDQAPERREGMLQLTIRRAADGLVLVNSSRLYSTITPGWQRFIFDPYFSSGTGDIELVLDWCGDGGPSFACSDMESIGFGDDERRSLALRVETGFAETKAPGVVSGLVGWRRVKGSDLVDNATWISSASADAEGSDCSSGQGLEIDWDQGCFRLQAQTGSLVGLYSPYRFPAGAKRGSLKVSLPNSASEPCSFLVAQIPDGVSQDQLVKICERIMAEAMVSGVHKSSGIAWSKAVVAGGEMTKIHLDLCQDMSAASGLFMAVQPTGKSQDYMSSQWHSFEWFVEDTEEADKQAAPDYSSAGQSHTVIRTYKFTELVYGLDYYKGKEELERISRQLGFSPFQLEGEADILQTHPFEGNASVALLSGGPVVSGKRILCEVATAHAAASDFIYVLGMLPSDKAQKSATIDQVLDLVKSGQYSGVDKKENVEWNALALQPMQTAQLALEIQNESDVACDLFFAALPTGEEARFAWCRWYSLLIESKTVTSGEELLLAGQPSTNMGKNT